MCNYFASIILEAQSLSLTILSHLQAPEDKSGNQFAVISDRILFFQTF